MVLFAFITLVVLHNIDGNEITINADQVTTLHHTNEAAGQTNKLIAGGHRCVIGLSNGKFVSVVEDCGMVRQAIKEAQGER